MRHRIGFIVATLVLSVSKDELVVRRAHHERTAVLAASGYVWSLPTRFPTPRVPTDNPMSDAKAALGRFLFYDTRLSGNGTQSCATCHEQARAFTDGRAQALGSTGEQHPRGSMSLVNVAYAAALTWG